MARHNNPSITQDVRRIFNTKLGEGLSNQVVDVLVPTIAISRPCTIVRQAIANNATSATIYTTPQDKDFYLTAAFLNGLKDAVSSTVDFALNVTIGGVVQQVLFLTNLTLTAYSGATASNFNPPILVDRGTTITVTTSSGAATCRIVGGIQGYTVETTSVSGM